MNPASSRLLRTTLFAELRLKNAQFGSLSPWTSTGAEFGRSFMGGAERLMLEPSEAPIIT